MRRKKENMMLCFPLIFIYYLHKPPKSFSFLLFWFFYYFQEAKPCFKHPYPALFSTVKQVSSKIHREAKKLWTIHYYARSSFYHCSNGWVSQRINSTKERFSAFPSMADTGTLSNDSCRASNLNFYKIRSYCPYLLMFSFCGRTLKKLGNLLNHKHK